MQLITILFFLLFFPAHFAYGSAMSDFANNYLSDLESSDNLVFVAGCYADQQQGKAVLLVIPENESGVIIEYSRAEVTNVAEIDFSDGFCFVSETHGGIYSYNKMREVCEKLSKDTFVLIYPFKVKSYDSLCITKSK